MPQFLVDPADVSGDIARLRGEEARHLSRVLRMRAGDPVLLFDGSGRRWRGTVLEPRDPAVVGSLRPLEPNEPPVGIELIQGLPKGDRWTWILEKGTELGVSRFRPVRTRRTVAGRSHREPGPRAARWARIVRAAAKQCERARIPRVDGLAELEEVLASLGPRRPDEVRAACVERLDGVAARWARPGEAPRTVIAAVGPEGGWSAEERRRLESSGFEPLDLGPRILRTDTAAVAALAWIGSRWGDLVPSRAAW